MNKTIKFFLHFTILLSAVFIFNSNIFAQTKIEILIVADKMTDCAAKRSCLQVKRIDEEKFSAINENIGNFKYVTGYFYVLEVSVSESAARNKYLLRKILARVKSESSSENSGQNLFGTEWKLTRIEGRNVNTDKAFIRFDDAKKSAGGNGGCNVFGGSFTRNGAQIKISDVFSTKMFCEETQEIENKFLELLEQTNRYEIKNGKLLLLSGNKLLLEFEARK